MEYLIDSAEIVSLFCRLNMNARKDLPIRSREMGMLIYLVKSDLDKTPLKIADFFKVTKPMVAVMTANLLKEDYIVKEGNPIDRRSFTLVPTDKAIQLVESMYKEYLRMTESLQEKMGEQRFSQMIELLNNANQILLEVKDNV